MSTSPRRAAKRAILFGFVALGLAFLAFAIGRPIASNQALSRADVFAGIGTSYSWSGTAQGWSTDHRLLTRGDITSFLQNNGTCTGSGTALVFTQSMLSACAVIANTHTPILANNTFSGGSVTSWSASYSYAGCTSGGTAVAVNGADEDSDSGYADEGSGVFCVNGNTVTVALTQSFSIAGNPASQSYSFWYRWTPVVEGDANNCIQQTGAVNNLQVVINSHTETTIPNPVGDSAWHHVSGTTIDLITGTNTFAVQASVSGARGNSLNGQGICSTPNLGAQTLDVDNASLTATW